MDETRNTFDEVQEPVVEAPTAEDATSEGTESGDGTSAPQQGGELATPKQTPEENARFAALRRQYEGRLQEVQAQREQAQQTQQRLMSSLQQAGYEGDADNIADLIDARRAGMTVEQLRSHRVAEQQHVRQLLQQAPEYRAAKTQARQYQDMVFSSLYEKDLAAINKAFPGARATSIDDLGEDFAAMRAGGVSALTAYAAVEQTRQAAARAMPPDIGAVHASGGKEKDYYSPEEVDRLTPQQLDNPKIMKVVMEAMTKWKK